MTTEAQMIDELRRLLGEATPGPWDYKGSTRIWVTPSRAIECDDTARPFADAALIAALIAAAVNALPSLLARLEAAEAVCERARRQHNAAQCQQHPFGATLRCLTCRLAEEADHNLGTALAHYDAVRKETR